MPGLLDGIRAFEFAAHGVGPIAGLVLAQFGAEVIKVEHPVGGDPTRGYARPDIHKVPPGNHTIIFEFTNRNKKSVTLDLSKEKGREIAYRLIEKSDVFVSNYLPKSLKQRGFDYETLVKYNPKLVYAASSSYGKNGPDSNKPAFDPMAIARSGLMMTSGEPDAPPVEIRGIIADCFAGSFLALSAIAGLLARERLGKGQEIETSLLGPLVWAQLWNVSQYLMGGQGMEKQSRTSIFHPLGNNYRCKDGRWIKVGTGMNMDTGWHEFCHVLGVESLEKDPRFDDMMKRQQNAEELVKILDNTFCNKTRDEWLEYFRAQKVNILYEGIYDTSELPNDPQVLANNYVVEEDHPTLGQNRMQLFPMNFSETPILHVLKPAPQLGEHTEEVLLEIGYSREEIAQLKNDKVI